MLSYPNFGSFYFHYMFLVFIGRNSKDIVSPTAYSNHPLVHSLFFCCI